MSVLIGHASIDENGKAAGGIGGDQTKREVCTRNWYKASWDVLIRCTDSKMAEKMAKACEQACKNDKIGYDQYQRNTLHTQAKKVNYDLSKITTACECDCSSLICSCAIAAGVPEDKLYIGGNMRTTRNMRDAFKKIEGFQILTDSKYLISDDYLKRGDILVNEGSHVVMVLKNGEKVEKPSYRVRITADALNVRSGAGTQYKINTVVHKNEVYTIVGEKNGWGKLKSGAGWISLKYTKRI